MSIRTAPSSAPLTAIRPPMPVFFGFSAQRNAAATQWSAPVTPGGGSDDRECRPVKIVRLSRNGSSGRQMNGSSGASTPTLSGTQ